MPIASLPSAYGIGCFSKEAYAFVDRLVEAGQHYWQILPLGPTGYGDSPYQSFSTYAGNPYFIDLEALIEEGLLTKKECEKYDFGKDVQEVDYEKIYLSRFKVLRVAYEKSKIAQDKEFQTFVSENAYWLPDYALYMAVKNSFGGVSWSEWDEDIRLRKKSALAAYAKKYADEILFYEFQQFKFAQQWKKLKTYANAKGVEIIGDIPIYVAFDSADTWANPELFQLDKENLPVAVAGCPPDAFSATGQLWGNPLYRWEYHEKTGFAWWMKRIGYCYQLYDVVRIDHFRGFDEYYSIPYGDKTAEFGHWEKGPGYALFKAMKDTLGKRRVIAEDLGFLTKSVIKLVEKTGFPGMKVLQFGFDSKAKDSSYLPHRYVQNTICYTGTHDNDTTKSWYQHLSVSDKRFTREYLGIKTGKDVTYAMIRQVLGSVSDTAVVPMQDYLELGGEARINFPSTLGGNWVWRMQRDAFTAELAAKMKALATTYAR